MMLEDNVQKLDEYFEGKKSNEKKLIFFAAFGVIAYGVYMLVNPYALEINQAVSAELEKATSEYNKLSDELKNTKALIPRQIQDIKQNTANIQKANQENSIASKKVQNLSNVLAPSSINVYLNEITRDAEDSNIHITKIDNAPGNIKPLSFSRFYDVNVTFDAKSFNNIIKYTKKLEESKDIIDIANVDIQINKNGTLDGHINITSWGVKYD